MQIEVNDLVMKIIEGPVAGFLSAIVATQIPLKIFDRITHADKTKQQRRQESLDNVYSPCFTEIYKKDYFNKVLYNDVKGFLNFLNDTFENYILHTAPSILGKFKNVQRRFANIDRNKPDPKVMNIQTGEIVDQKFKLLFKELVDMLSNRYYHQRKQLYYFDISLIDSIASASLLRYFLVLIYISSSIIWVVDTIIVLLLGIVVLPTIIIFVVSMAVTIGTLVAIRHFIY